MGTDEEKPQRNETLMQRSTPETRRAERLGWIIDQLSLAAVAKGQVFMPERLRINAEDLVDIPQEQLALAFARARRELDYAPGVAEIRRLAAVDEPSQRKVEAQAAWDYVNEYLRKWGVELLPLYSKGKVTTPPPLDARSDYALRRIGGLRALNNMDVEKMPFMYRDFCEAYALAPVAELMALPLREQFGNSRLQGNMKQLMEARLMEQRTKQPKPRKDATPVQRSDEWYAERKAELKQQADELLAKREREEPFDY